MNRYLLGSVALVASLVVGCGGGGGSCCGAKSGLDVKGEQQLLPQLPTATINRVVKADVSASQNESKNNVDGEVYRVPTINVVNVYSISFDCKNSIDNDLFDANENNKSIERCDWNITKPAGCQGPSLVTAETVELNCTDTSADDTVFVKLTVTDDENQTAETNTTVIY